MSLIRNSLKALPDRGKNMVCKRLSNLDEITPIPIILANETLIVGFGPETETDEIWGELYRKLGCGAHCV